MSAGAREPSPWRPSGVVTFTTDFGIVDPYVGIMKGVLLARTPSATPVDLTHAVPPQDVVRGGWFLARSYRWFPPGTVHVAVVDPGVGSGRRILVAREGDQAFLAPDNGLLEQVLSPAAWVGRLDEARFALPDPSSTFHGRDVFTPAAAALAGGVAPEEAAAQALPDWCSGPEQGGAPASWSRRADGSFEVRVLLTDHFGNLLTDFDPSEHGVRAGEWGIELDGRWAPLGVTYADGEPGEPLALTNSYGTLELALRDGSAAEKLGIGPGDALLLKRAPA